MLGGSGSLLLRTDIRGPDAHVEPFVIGDIDPSRTFVHVFDDTTLDIVMSTLDTAADFLRYLREKERICRTRILLVAGEENLLANHLARVDEDGEHALLFEPNVDVIAIDDSWWEDFARSNERAAQNKHDQVSYVWDRLIERFAEHALGGTQYNATIPELESSEKILRFMAAEPRLRRRTLGEALLDAVHTTPSDQRRIRVIHGRSQKEPMYVLLLFPWLKDKPEDDNRELRRGFLEACVLVARMKQGDALDVIGIATESGGSDLGQRSEDALYFDARDWDASDDDRARSLQRDLDILVRERVLSKHVVEYPVDQVRSKRLPKNPRNKPCPCGSGSKYKHCHGR